MSALEKARAAWGEPPAWIVALAGACDAASQNQLAQRLGVSRQSVNNLLANRYIGDLDAMRNKIERELQDELRRAAAPGWGDAVPAWVTALAEACTKAPQAVVARRIGYSPTVVSQVLSRTYKGNYRRVEMQVRGALLGETTRCLVVPTPLELHCCVNAQENLSDHRRGGSLQLAHWLQEDCPKCPNYLKRKEVKP